MFDRILFVIGEGLTAFRRNGFMAFAAISTIAISLFMLGGLGFTYVRLSDASRELTGKFEIRVFLKEKTTMAQIHQVATDIRALPGVGDVSHIPRDKAWEREKREHPDLTAGLENPLPDAFKITLKDLKRGDEVAEAIRRMKEAEPANGVQYLKKEQGVVDQAMSFLKWLSSLGILLFVTAGILIYNAIRLAVISRKLEIRIMQLVGASRFTVQAPFTLEGILQGVLGGAFAALFVYVAQLFIFKRMALIDPSIHPAPFPTAFMFWLLCGIGGVYGIVCSLIAVRVPLNNR